MGLVVGTIDIMRGGLTAISRSGELQNVVGTALPFYNPLEALVWQIMHLFSDGFTRMGLPAPGWSLLQLFNVGSFGEKRWTVAEVARFMYLKGYDSRHFLTMGSSVAAAEVVLRGYFTIRMRLDEAYEAEAAHEGELAAAGGVGDHPRYQAMALAAHGIAAAANAGKVVCSGSPLAINYDQWLWFLRSLFRWLQSQHQPVSDVLTRQARINLRALEIGWPDFGVGHADLPSLVVDSTG